MSKLRVVTLVSGSGSNLKAIFHSEFAAKLDFAGVVSDRQCPALDWAGAQGIRASAIPFPAGNQAERKERRPAWNDALRAQVAALSPDVIVLAGFMRILSADFVNAFESKIVNVHPSLLPAFPGAHAPRDAIEAGVRVSGCTVHLVDEGVDTGPILAQVPVPVLPGDDAKTLHRRIQQAEHRLFPAVIGAIAEGNLNLSTQTWQSECAMPQGSLWNVSWMS